MKKVFAIICVLSLLFLTACGERNLYLPESQDDAIYETAGGFGGV